MIYQDKFGSLLVLFFLFFVNLSFVFGACPAMCSGVCSGGYVCGDSGITDANGCPIGTCLPPSTSCFLPGTKIETGNGVKAIENIKPGDVVKSFTIDGKVVNSQVSTIFERERDFYFELKTFGKITGKSDVKVSAEHPFLTDKKNNKFTQVQYLKPGDMVFVKTNDNKDYLESKVISNVRIDKKTPVYNMSVDNTHTYFANGFAVHNKGQSYLACSDITPGTHNSCGALNEPGTWDCRNYSSSCAKDFQPNYQYGAPYPGAPVCDPNELGTGGYCHWNCMCCPFGSERTLVAGVYQCVSTLCTLVNGACGANGGKDFASPPATGLCATGTVEWTDKIATDGIYSWNCLGTCSGTDKKCTATRNFAPIFTTLTLKNNLSINVPPETGNKNQICHRIFNGSRTINITVGASDPDGLADITDIRLRWNGYGLTRTSLANGVATFSYTFGNGQNDPDANNFEVNITDSVGNTTGWVNGGRSFKVWNCNVPITYHVYDGSLGQACNNTGFSLPLTINDISFKNMSGGADATTNFVWSDSYLPLVNGGTVGSIDGSLAASSRFTRLIDGGVGTTICPVASQFNVSTSVFAYSTIPALTIDLSYIKDQENWFVGKGLDIRAGEEISSGVPKMANSALSLDNLTIGSSNGGIVASASFRNTNGWTDNTQYGLPNNWRVNKALIDSQKYNYQTLYNDFYTKLGVGMTNIVSIGTGSSGILFVNGDLNIDSDVVVPITKYLMVIVNGTVNIGIGASRVDGIFVANGGIGATGSTDNQLNINGVLYAANNSSIRLARRFATPSLNNMTPAVVVNYRPSMVFALPGILNKVFSGWSEQ